MMRMQRAGGLSLIEVLISLAIIGILFAALAFTQVGTMRITAASREASDATQVAVQKLDHEIKRVLEALTNEETDLASELYVVDAAFEDEFGGSGSYTIKAADSEFAGSEYERGGLVFISVKVTQPSQAEVATFVSCTDAEPAPTVRNPGSACPGFGDGS